MALVSDNIKAVLFIGDFLHQAYVHRDKCMLVKQYEYTLCKSRKDNGEVYDNATSGSILEVSFNIGSRDSMKPFYERCGEFSPTTVSILFNVTYDEDGRMREYENAMLAEGYVVDVEEDYDIQTSVEGRQMNCTVRFLINGIKYVGEFKNLQFYN